MEESKSLFCEIIYHNSMEIISSKIYFIYLFIYFFFAYYCLVLLKSPYKIWAQLFKALLA